MFNSYNCISSSFDFACFDVIGSTHKYDGQEHICFPSKSVPLIVSNVFKNLCLFHIRCSLLINNNWLMILILVLDLLLD